MKFVTTIAAAVLLAGAAQAKDITVAGQTLSLGAEADMNYTTGVEAWALDFTPYLGAEIMGFGLTVEAPMNLLDLDDQGLDGTFTGLEFTSRYVLTDSMSVYGEVATNKDLEFGDTTVGASFKF
jgi:hypothetical protein